MKRYIAMLLIPALAWCLGAHANDTVQVQIVKAYTPFKGESVWVEFGAPIGYRVEMKDQAAAERLIAWLLENPGAAYSLPVTTTEVQQVRKPRRKLEHDK